MKKVVCLLLFFKISLIAQSACPTVSVTPTNATLCSGCTTLTASVQGTVSTTSYTVAPTPYTPYSFDTGTPVLIHIDDTWSNIINLPFCFEFYGNTYSQVLIGSNGIITFDVSQANSYCEWNIMSVGPIPTAALQKNSIMGPYHDIDPSFLGDTYWQVVGTAPCRAFVVSYYEVPYYGDPNSIYTGACSNPLFATHQIVFYESTNIIDVYIQDKPYCTGWNNGLTIEGIQNATGTAAVAVPGRNNTVWAASNDGQRFTPSGDPQYSLTWTAPPSTTVIGTGSTINVCPTTNTTYTATLVNNTCNGPVTVTADATITLGGTGTPPTMSSTLTDCSSNTGTATATPFLTTDPLTYLWNPTGQTTQTATGLAAGTYTVTITDTATSCTATNSVTVDTVTIIPTFNNIDPICSGDFLATLPTTSTNGITGTWLPMINNTESTTYTFTPAVEQCAETTTLSINVIPNVIPIFDEIDPYCANAVISELPTTSINGITGTWSPAINNSETTIYTFTPLSGECATKGSLTVTVQNDFDFEIIGSCVGNDFILQVSVIDTSFDVDTANFNWFYNTEQSGFSNSNIFNVTEFLTSNGIDPIFPILFSVTITTPDGCFKNKSITLDNIFCGIQKGISVNNDNFNDFFDLRLLNVKNLSIFNRYGMKVYSKGQYKDEWKGQSDKGDELPDGTYYYVIDFNDGKDTKIGWIHKLKKS